MDRAAPLRHARSSLSRLLRSIIAAPWTLVYSGALIFFLFLPVFMIVVFSFNNSVTGVFPLAGFTTRWYNDALRSPLIWDALGKSLYVAICTCLLTALLGTPAAIVLTRYEFRFKSVLRAFVSAPLSLPPLITAVALLSFFTALSVPRSLNTVIIGHVVFCMVYIVLVVGARLEDFDRTIEEAAYDLGATPLQTFRHITFPLIRSSIIGGMLLAFSESFNMFVITLFNIGPESTLPMVMWSMMRRGITPQLNAVSVIVLVPSVIVLIVINRYAEIRLEM